ncbi:proteophosphoglycan ppg4 [Ceratobasidium sp. AG-Ba]|nr:proteophosphoglycan ppg4 [Ceratobasidium sp. AG-Ba]
MAGKKKTAAQKRAAAAARAVSPLPETSNTTGNAATGATTVGAADVPSAKVDDKQESKIEVSEPNNEATKDTASTPTPAPTTPTTEAPVATAETPSAPLPKAQKKKARKASAGASGAITPVQTTDNKPSDNPESTAMNGGLDDAKATAEDGKAADTGTEVDSAADDAWGFDDAETSPAKRVKSPAAPSEAGTVMASKLESDDTPSSKLNGATPDPNSRKLDDKPDNTPPSDPAPPPSITSPDGVSKASDVPISSDPHPELPKRGTLPPETSGSRESGTRTSGMPAVDDDDAPLLPPKTNTILKTPTNNTMTSKPASAQVEPERSQKPGATATPKPQQQSPVSPITPVNATPTGQGLFSNGPVGVKPLPSPSASSPTSGVPGTRGPGSVGFGGVGLGSTRPSTSSASFGFGQSQQKPTNLPPPPSATPSWGAPKSTPTPAASSSKPAPLTKPASKGWGWGFSDLVNKAQNALETALADEPAQRPPPPPTKQARQQPPASAPSPMPAPVLSPAAEPAAPPKKSSFDERIAAIRAKHAPKKVVAESKPESPVAPPSPAVTVMEARAPEPPVTPIKPTPKPSMIPTLKPNASISSNSILSPNKSSTSANPLSLSSPSNSARDPEVTSSPVTAQVTEDSAAPPARAESVVSSKTVGSGLRLSMDTDKERERPGSASSLPTNPPSMIPRRPSLVDMRSTSSPSPKAPGGTFSPFGAGLGQNRFNNGRPGLFAGFAGANRFNSIEEDKKEKEKDKMDDDLSSVVSESVQDVDSLVDMGKDEEEEQPQLGSTEDLAAMVDPTVQSEPTIPPAPIVVSPLEPIALPKPIVPEATILEPTVLVPEPISVPEPKVEPVVVPPSPPEPEPLIPAFAPAPEPETQDSLVEPEAQPEADTTEAIDVDEAEFDLDDKTVAAPPDLGSPERIAAFLPDISTGFSLIDEPNPWGQDIMKVEETPQAQEAPMAEEPPKVKEEPQVVEEPQVEEAKSQEPPEIEEVPKIEQTPEVEEPLKPEPIAELVAQEEPIAANDAAPTPDAPITEPPATEPLAIDPVPAPETVDLPASPDVEIPRPVEQPPTEPAPTPSMSKKDRKRAKKALAIEVPSSDEPLSSPAPKSAMPKSPLPVTAIPKSPAPISTIPKSPVPTSALPTSPTASAFVPPSTSGNKKKKKKGKKAAEPVEEPTPTTEPSVVEPPAAELEHVAEPVTAATEPTSVAVVEEKPVVEEISSVAEETPTPIEDIAVVEASAPFEIPVVDSTPALIDLTPEVTEPTLVALEPVEQVDTPKFDFEVAIAPVQTEPAPETVHAEEVAVPEVKGDGLSEAIIDAPVTPKVEETTLPEGPKDPAPDPIVVSSVEEAKSKEEPASPSATKSAKAAKKAAKKAGKRKGSLHVSEPGPPPVAEAEPIPPFAAEESLASLIGVEAGPVLPPSKEPEVINTPTEVVTQVETVPVDELPKENDVVEELLGNSTPRPVAHGLPDAVDQVVEDTLISFSDTGVEEMKVEEVALDSEVIDGTDVVRTPKAETMILEEIRVKDSQFENPKIEEAAAEEPLVVITEVPITPEPIVMDLMPEETPVKHVAETIPATPVPEVIEAPPTPVVESSKKNKRKKKKEKEKANTKTEVVEGPAPVELEAVTEPILAARVEPIVTVEPAVETVDEKPVPMSEKPESILDDIAVPETAIEPAAPKSPLEAGTSDAPALPAASATAASPVESVVAKPFTWSASPKSPSVPAAPASPTSPKEKEKAKPPVTPVESRFSFFRHLLRKPDPIPMPEPQAKAETSDMRLHSPTASELALDLDTPVNLTPRITEAKLPEVQSPVEVAPVPVEPLPAFTESIAPISEPPTPELHHEVLEKKLSMALEQAESIIEEQETHPESTSMPDPPPAYSSPKMEPTTEVAQSIVISEPEATPEILRPEVAVQPVTVSGTAVEPEPDLHAEPNVDSEPKVIPEPKLSASSASNPEPTNSSHSVPILDPIVSESEPVKRKKRSSKKIKRDKTPDVPRNIEPVVAAVIVAETPFVAPLPSVEQVRKPSTPPVDGLPSPMPELLASKNRGFASPVLPSAHESAQTVPSSKPKTRAAMPPLISIPVSNPLEEASRKESSMKESATAESDLETRPQPVPTSSTAQTSAPQAISPPALTPKASYDTFSPFRWLGFGPSALAAPAAKAPECNPNTSSQIANEAEAPLPTPVSPLKEDKKERKEKSSRVSSTSTSNIVLTRTPTSPSPAVEKIEWSRWPYRPAANAVTAESKHEKVPTTRGSEAARTVSRTGTSRASSQGTATPVVSLDVISPTATSPAIPAPPPVTPVSARPATTQSSRASLASAVPTIPVQVIPAVPLATAVQETTSLASQEATRPKDLIAAREERRKERAEKRAAAQRASATSPISHTPSVSFQSPRSTDEPLPMHSPRVARAESSEAGPRPTPRGILKQRPVDTITNPSIPRVTPAARGGVTKLEFTGSRDVPIYDDWEHAPKIRQDILAATSSVRSPHERRTPGTSPVSPGQGRSPVAEGSHHRPRLAGLSPGVVSPSSKAPLTYAPSPSTSSDDRSTTKGARVRPQFVPTLHETAPRVRPTLRTSRIATPVLRSPADTYVETLASPILLASDNYSARVPEGTIYQYDEISPSESLTPTIRKEIFDALQKTVAPQVFTPLARASYDGRKMMYAHRKLNVRSKQQFSVELPGTPGSEQVYTVSLKRMAEIAPQIVPAFRG